MLKFNPTAGAPALADGGMGGGPTPNPGDHTITDGRAARAEIEIQVLIFCPGLQNTLKAMKTRENCEKTICSSASNPSRNVVHATCATASQRARDGDDDRRDDDGNRRDDDDDSRDDDDDYHAATCATALNVRATCATTKQCSRDVGNLYF